MIPVKRKDESRLQQKFWKLRAWILRSVCWLISPPRYCSRNLEISWGCLDSFLTSWIHFPIFAFFLGQNGHFARFPIPIHDPLESTRQVLGEKKSARIHGRTTKTRGVLAWLMRLSHSKKAEHGWTISTLEIRTLPSEPPKEKNLRILWVACLLLYAIWWEPLESWHDKRWR